MYNIIHPYAFMPLTGAQLQWRGPIEAVSIEICWVWGLPRLKNKKIRGPNNFEIWGAPPLFEAVKMVNDIIKIELTIKSVPNFNNEIKIQLSNLKLCCLKALLRYNRATSNTFDLFDSWLTFWRRNYYFFLNFSTPCIQNVNNTGTKHVRIMKQTAFWREKNGQYITCVKYSVPIFVE